IEGRGAAANSLVLLLRSEGRWLAVAWGVAALARGRAAAPLAAGLLIAAVLIGKELAPLTGLEAAARADGVTPEEAGSLAAAVDQNEGGVDVVLIFAGIAMGAGAALWRHGTGHLRAAGVALLIGALLRDAVAGGLDVDAAAVLLVLLVLVLLYRLVERGSRLVAVAAAIGVAAVLVVLPAVDPFEHREIQVIK
ncbi:MAG: DUF6518 family protein, partial [Actinomycetota bacterium]|nr:DUF6518 family protein [Actinomycetota bacterium]